MYVDHIYVTGNGRLTQVTSPPEISSILLCVLLTLICHMTRLPALRCANRDLASPVLHLTHHTSQPTLPHKDRLVFLGGIFDTKLLFRPHSHFVLWERAVFI